MIQNKLTREFFFKAKAKLPNDGSFGGHDQSISVRNLFCTKFISVY